MLVFKRKYHEGIKNGEITEAIKYWYHWKAQRFKAGETYYCYDLGYLRLDSIERITLNDLTQNDAFRCGEPSLDKLKEVCLEVYGKIFPNKDIENDIWYRLRFTFVSGE
ncbi:MAG: ASCH domain-containing protein [Nanobdellota archaeon]